MKIVSEKVHNYFQYDDGGASLCRCLAITPNLVVHSGLQLKLVILIKAPPRSIHCTAFFLVYTNFCSFGCITHISMVPVKRPQPVICDFSRDRRGPGDG